MFEYECLDLTDGEYLRSDQSVGGLHFKKGDIDTSVFNILGSNGWEMCGCYQFRPGVIRYWFKRKSERREANEQGEEG